MESVFKVDDDVWCMMKGKGRVIKITEECTYSVDVDFENGDTEEYTADGRINKDYPPTLGFTKIEMSKPNQVRPKWRAETCDNYYYIDSSGNIKARKETKDCWDNDFFKVGNYFKSVEQAKESKLYLSYIREGE